MRINTDFVDLKSLGSNPDWQRYGKATMNILSWLEEWYSSNCDKNWEHFYGVRIETLDNPGWSVKIDLTDTPFENRVFEEYEIDNGNDDWIRCRVKDHIFHGVGDSRKLEKIIQKFKEYTD